MLNNTSNFEKNYQFILNENETLFNAFVENSPYTNVYQLSSWAKVKNHFQSFRISLKKENTLYATALVLIRHLPLGLKFAYIPRGPILDYTNTDLFQFFIQKIKDFVKKQGCFLLKIDPPVEKSRAYLKKGTLTEKEEQGQLWSEVFKTFEKEGFKHQGFHTDLHSTLQPRFQAVIFKEDFEKFHSSSIKSYIKLAQKNHISATQVPLDAEDGHEHLVQFYRCIQSTEKRQGILLRNFAYFEKICQTFKNKSKLFLARLDVKQFMQQLDQELADMLQKEKDGGFINEKKQKEFLENLEFLKKKHTFFKQTLEQLDPEDKKYSQLALAANLCLTSGQSVEMVYAGTRSEFVKLYAQYLSYHHCFETLFAQGYTSVNLGGISGDFKDGLSGFKGRFSPCILEFLGEFDYYLSPFKQKLYQLLLKSFSFYKNLKKALRKS